MAASAPHEQLRRARAERGEDLAALSARTGLRIHHVRAIEAGRFADLPAGLYGRAAIRSFALAYGLDAEEILAASEELLPRVEDPIAALARMRGVTPAHAAAAAAAAPATVARIAAPAWRPFAAATVDGAVAGALLVGTSGGAALLARVSLRALGPSAVALFVPALLLGAVYYVWLGGLGGTTFGEYAVGPDPRQRDPRPLTLAAIARRTVAAATADARAIYGLGLWVGRRLTPDDVERTAPPRVLSPSSPPPPGRGEALTWSMNRRASVPPPPLHPRRG